VFVVGNRRWQPCQVTAFRSLSQERSDEGLTYLASQVSTLINHSCSDLVLFHKPDQVSSEISLNANTCSIFLGDTLI
jgi:hypothetical protein